MLRVMEVGVGVGCAEYVRLKVFLGCHAVRIERKRKMANALACSAAVRSTLLWRAGCAQGKEVDGTAMCHQLRVSQATSGSYIVSERVAWSVQGLVFGTLFRGAGRIRQVDVLEAARRGYHRY